MTSHAITIRQPYAGLIVDGVKKVETRTRRTHFRGRLYIHAAKMENITAVMEACEENHLLAFYVFGILIETADLQEEQRKAIRGKVATMQRAAIVGHVTVIDCVPGWQYHAGRTEYGNADDGEREWSLGDLSGDRWAWILKNPVKYAKPILCNGQQGFWDCSKYL